MPQKLLDWGGSISEDLEGGPEMFIFDKNPRHF